MDVRRHKRVKHTAGEYVSRAMWTTNTVESYFFNFPNAGMRGTYQHCVPKRICIAIWAEFDFP